MSKILAEVMSFIDNLPVWCSVCKRMIFEKDAIPERLVTGATVKFCKKCHNDMYHPFTK